MNIKTLQHTIQVTEKVLVPSFEEFGDTPNVKIEFLVCNFHDQYNGLIGNNILRQLKAIVNLKDNVLTINDRNLHIRYTNDSVEYYFERKGLHEVILPIEQKEGLIKGDFLRA